jgi:hypothetical protein
VHHHLARRYPELGYSSPLAERWQPSGTSFSATLKDEENTTNRKRRSDAVVVVVCTSAVGFASRVVRRGAFALVVGRALALSLATALSPATALSSALAIATAATIFIVALGFVSLVVVSSGLSRTFKRIVECSHCLRQKELRERRFGIPLRAQNKGRETENAGVAMTKTHDRRIYACHSGKSEIQCAGLRPHLQRTSDNSSRCTDMNPRPTCCIKSLAFFPRD